MSSRIDRRRGGAAPWLATDLSNFAAWYLPTLVSKPAAMFQATRALEPALPGLVELHANEGELEARFEREGVTSSYSFDELSDGERSLVALYVVLHALAVPGKVLLLDEPDNYLGLREIQPWLAELTDRALKSDGPQVILISHHPEALNFLAPERGFRMFRDSKGPTRIERFKPQEDLRPDEVVARGLDDAR
jgi:predicted ATPase